jgi:2-polyprenyl-3-methyl-5-hydroxy-6-metoxy-1,4-benzoquinol methylase
MSCPLCLNPEPRSFQRVEEIDYHRCDRCHLTWMSPTHLPSRKEERRQYDLHENDPDDPGYRRFLSRLTDPLMAGLAPGSEGLDFGCGPGPALAAMMSEAGHPTRAWDPLYFPAPELLERDYDFVTCTEVVEHLHRPAREFALLQRLLRPGGHLAVMTSWLTDDEAFAQWHYRRDPTHVCFYRVETLEWIARHFGWQLELPAKNVAIYRKPRSAQGGQDPESGS